VRTRNMKKSYHPNGLLQEEKCSKRDPPKDVFGGEGKEKGKRKGGDREVRGSLGIPGGYFSSTVSRQGTLQEVHGAKS